MLQERAWKVRLEGRFDEQLLYYIKDKLFCLNSDYTGVITT
jgi:hypothetical protein